MRDWSHTRLRLMRVCHPVEVLRDQPGAGLKEAVSAAQGIRLNSPHRSFRRLPDDLLQLLNTGQNLARRAWHRNVSVGALRLRIGDEFRRKIREDAQGDCGVGKGQDLADG